MKKLFLSLLKDAKTNNKSNKQPFNDLELYQLAKIHQVIPLIYQQIYTFDFQNQALKQQWKKEAMMLNALQVMKTNRFLNLYQQLLKNELKVLVVKGIICRELYPYPDQRPSNDEDLYVQEKDFEKVKTLFLEEGLQLVKESDDVSTFVCRQSGLSIELHRSLFNEESEAYGNYQDYFKNAFTSPKVHQIQGVSVYSLNATHHLLFLFLHFVKHFLHGGVGVRQILDICLYIEQYNDEIDWNDIATTLTTLQIYTLVMNMLLLANEYFAFDINLLPSSLSFEKMDYEDLLEDIIDAGVFGKSTEERLHSSTITLNATKTGKTSILKTIFPTKKEMIGKYSYLNHYPFLLPLAWVQRIIHYITHRNFQQSQKTIEIGNQRIELLKKYKVIK